MDTVVQEWLPRLHGEGLVDSVDIFVENIGFSAEQAIILFEAAQSAGPGRENARRAAFQHRRQPGRGPVSMPCPATTWSTPTPEDAAALAKAGTVAVLLPVAFYGLRETRTPPITAFRAACTRMAVATDCNPGSAPGASLLLAMSMATRFFGLTPEEVLAGVTCNAAARPGPRASSSERSTAGAAADFVVWAIREPEELGYWVGLNPCRAVIRSGRLALGRLP